MAMYFHSDVSSYENSSDEEDSTSLYGDGDDNNVKQVVLPLECFYKKVLFDLLISRNDDFFNYCFEQIFSRKLQATINGDSVTYDQLKLHFLSLRRAYNDTHTHHHHHHSSYPSSSSSSSSSSSISSLPHAASAASAFAPDGSVLKFGPFLANAHNGGREGYLAGQTILANLIMNDKLSNGKWSDASPLLTAAQLSSEHGSKEEGSTASSSSSSNLNHPSSSSDSSSSEEPEEQEAAEITSPRKRRFRNHHHSSSSNTASSNRIRYNALVVTDTMEIQWMEGKDGECRKITKFERCIRRPGVPSSTSNTSSSSTSSNAIKNVKQRRC